LIKQIKHIVPVLSGAVISHWELVRRNCKNLRINKHVSTPVAMEEYKFSDKKNENEKKNISFVILMEF